MVAKGMPVNRASGVAYQMLDGAVTKQSTLLSYVDVFLWVGILFLVCVPFILLFIKTARKKVEIAADMH
jgi:DHA2 family multidrug resistance protein